MHEFIITANYFLKKDVRAFYHTDYVGYEKPGNPDYLNRLKNTYGGEHSVLLDIAVQELKSALNTDLPRILNY